MTIEEYKAKLKLKIDAELRESLKKKTTITNPVYIQGLNKLYRIIDSP